jgi:hypothetical protein
MSIIRKTVRTVKTIETKKVRTVKITRIKKRPTKPQGVILYRGPSLLDGSPIVCVATGLARKSKNPKTGNAVQTYIVADNGENPIEANRSGGDAAVCGNCPHRDGTCYVNIAQAPLAVYRAVQAGSYPKFNAKQHLSLFKGRFLRLGSYGDPAAVPIQVWETLCSVASHHTGYTHQWRTCHPAYAAYCMASVETAAQRLEAIAKGWRTFRVRLPNQPIEPGEFVCPASQEAGRRLTCDECKACSGSKGGGKNATPVILFHGSSIAGNRTLRMYERTMTRLETEEKTRRVPLTMVN